MQKLILLCNILILNLIQINSQNYIPFNANMPKRFENIADSTDDNYYFYPRKRELLGNTTVFWTHISYSMNTIEELPINCSNWGGSSYPLADTNWLCKKIFWNNQIKELTVLNKNSESIIFNFNLNLSDSSLLYGTVNDGYYLKLDSLQNTTFFSLTDSVKYFSIWRYDLNNQLVPSELNGFTIKLSKNYGLLSLFDCSNFPIQEKAIILKGQLNPNFGYYNMTYDEVFPWQAGDSFQYKGLRPSQWFTSTISYRTTNVTNRIETNDSVYIYLTSSFQNFPSFTNGPYPLSYFNISYPNIIKFKKNTPISDKPNNIYDIATGNSYFNETYSFCDGRNSLYVTGSFDYYCESCDCFVPQDNSGSSYYTTRYAKGLGIVYSRDNIYGQYSYSPYAEIIYSNVGGITCGSLYYLNTEELNLNSSLQLFPNPTQNEFFISLENSNEPNLPFKIMDISGKVVLQSFANTNTAIDISTLPNGYYIVQVQVGEQYVSKPLIVNR
jgi:hypothetical protein